jgi:ornithine cyclodeaminase/alanine dehydrogenase
MLVNPVINNFIAVLDGAYITNARTGAQTAVSLKYIYGGGSSERKPIRLGIYGAGMQGHMQTLAISKLFDITELRIYDISKAALEKFKADMAEHVAGEIICCDDPRDAANADAVICVTQANDKFLKKDWIAPGTIVFPMGSYHEAEDELLLSADHIIVDHIAQALHRGALSGLVAEGKLSEKDIDCTIGDLAAGNVKPDIKPGEIVICAPIGTGAMDIGCAGYVYQKALAEGNCASFDFGTSSALTLDEVPHD